MDTTIALTNMSFGVTDRVMTATTNTCRLTVHGHQMRLVCHECHYNGNHVPEQALTSNFEHIHAFQANI
jgi:hypothetical protein